MNLTNVLNIYFGSAIVIILTIAECVVNYSKNRSYRKFFLIILIITLIFLIIDIFFSLLDISIFKASLKFIWSAAASLLLFLYLFMVTDEKKIDNLTGLNNRYSFFEYTSELSRKKNAESWNFIILDIDNFKSINNVYGYIEGDHALRCFANIITKYTGKPDFTARYGGDEFIIVTKEDSGGLINKIKEELIKYNENSKKLYNIEINHGYAKYTPDGSSSIDEVINYIDNSIKKQIEANRRANDITSGYII